MILCLHGIDFLEPFRLLERSDQLLARIVRISPSSVLVKGESLRILAQGFGPLVFDLCLGKFILKHVRCELRNQSASVCRPWQID